jgi:PAS domain S-box-containing protein
MPRRADLRTVVFGLVGHRPTHAMHESREQTHSSRSWRLLSREAVVYYALDLDGSVSSVEGPFENLFGSKWSELVGQDQPVVSDRRLLSIAEQQFREHVNGKGGLAVTEHQIVNKHGDSVPVLATSVPVRNSQGAIVGTRGMIHAIGDFVAAPPTRRPNRETPGRVEDLTPRQNEVLQLLSQGLTTGDIARRLVVTEETARHHIRAILRAFGAHSRLEAVVLALRLGVIRFPDL